MSCVKANFYEKVRINTLKRFNYACTSPSLANTAGCMSAMKGMCRAYRKGNAALP